MLCKWLHIHLVRLQPLCQNQLKVIMVLVCTFTNQYGKVTPDAAGHRLWTAPSPLHDNSTALVVTSPPFLNVVDYRRDNWLRCWFAGIDTSTLPRCTGSLELWANHLSTVLSEIHRILKPGGHAAIEVGEIRNGKLRLEETVAECGHRGGLVPVKFLIQNQSFTKTARCWGIKNNSDGTNTHRVVLFQKQ